MFKKILIREMFILKNIIFYSRITSNGVNDNR